METVVIYIRHRVEKSELHISKLTSAKISYFLHSHPFLRVSLLKSHPPAYFHLLSISLTFPLAFKWVGSSFVPRLEASIPDIFNIVFSFVMLTFIMTCCPSAFLLTFPCTCLFFPFYSALKVTFPSPYNQPADVLSGRVSSRAWHCPGKFFLGCLGGEGDLFPHYIHIHMHTRTHFTMDPVHLQ